MSFARVYLRVLGLLSADASLAVTLAAANIALAAAQFVEPVLFGRIVDALSGALPAGIRPAALALAPLLGAWVAFGLFIIVAGTVIAWFADRLAHRRRNLVLADYFEHVLQLPLAYHTGAHSGRQMKIMLSGTDTLWWLWVSFFREHFAAFVFIALLLPATLFLNWRLALPLLALCVGFTALTVLVMQRAYAMQRTVEQHYSDLAETAADALGNVALVQSYRPHRDRSVRLRSLVNSLLRAQMPVLSWWAVAEVLTRAGTTLTLLVILLVGTYLKLVGLASVGHIVSFMSIAALLIARLEQVVSFANRLFLDAPKLADFFGVLDTVPAVRDRPDAVDPGRAARPCRIRGRIVFLRRQARRRRRPDLQGAARRTHRAGRPDRQRQVDGAGAAASRLRSAIGRHHDRRHGYPRPHADGLRRNIGVVFQETLLFNRSIAENLRVGKPDATDAEMREAAARAQALEFIDRNAGGFEAPIGERGRLLSGGERQRLAIARALLKDPPILILDEATSALDPVTEQRVNLALDEVMKGRTTFVIAHRLATVRNATRILVFQNGRIIETGTFDELVKRGGFFSELVQAQFAPSLPLPAARGERLS